MGRKAFLSIALGLTALTCLGSVLSARLSQAVAIREPTYYCGHLYFGSEKNSGGSEIKDALETIQSSSHSLNVSLSSIDSSRCYFQEGGYALRIGSGSNLGSVTFTFRTALDFEYVEVYAWNYESSGTNSLSNYGD